MNNKYREVSPERSKVWTEKSPKYHQKFINKVQIVYYISKNHQLEHPHFMEVLLSSPQGLYLKDVIERLNVLRGKGMASMYSWSSKRSYRNGFVWQDLSEDDLILPSHGNEYVLKGSELFEESKSMKEPPSSTSMDGSSSSSSLNNEKDTNNVPKEDDELSSQALRSVSSDSREAKNTSSWCLAQCKSERFADASTQTDENVNGCSKKLVESFSRSVSGDNDSSSSEPESNNLVSAASCLRKEIESGNISRNSVSSSSNNASSLGEKTDTLESLIRADVSKMNSFRILEQEDARMTVNPRLSASNMLMQLISCGSIAVKDNSLGLVPTYKPKLGHSKFPSPFFSSSYMTRDLDHFNETPSLMSLRLEEKERFSGSLFETKQQKKDGNTCSLKRSSSYNGDSLREASCIVSKQQPHSESMRCIGSEKAREDEENVIKIDERLLSHLILF
ncbi:unnamed protein product [Cochlearia groenlandica]